MSSTTEKVLPPEDGVWTIDRLITAEATGHRLKFVHFWGHTPPSGATASDVGKHVFSQWFVAPFTVDGVEYRSAEHFMMAGKARLFDDNKHLAMILAAESPAEAKKLGRLIRGFEPDTWDQHCVDIVTLGSVAKFSATEELRDYLVGTGDRVLVEASPRDPIWGIGMAQDDPAANTPSQWRGRNLLGLALMQARARLRG